MDPKKLVELSQDERIDTTKAYMYLQAAIRDWEEGKTHNIEIFNYDQELQTKFNELPGALKCMVRGYIEKIHSDYFNQESKMKVAAREKPQK